MISSLQQYNIYKADRYILVFYFLPGIIHRDISEQNILVKRSGDNWEIAGLIDFEDATYDLKVYEISICMMYMMSNSDNPMDIGGHCLQGFVKKRKLSQSELDMLYYCVCAHFMRSLIAGLYNYSVTKDPYKLVSQKSWKALKLLWDLPAQKALQIWLSV